MVFHLCMESWSRRFFLIFICVLPSSAPDPFGHAILPARPRPYKSSFSGNCTAEGVLAANATRTLCKISLSKRRTDKNNDSQLLASLIPQNDPNNATTWRLEESPNATVVFLDDQSTPSIQFRVNDVTCPLAGTYDCDVWTTDAEGAEGRKACEEAAEQKGGRKGEETLGLTRRRRTMVVDAEPSEIVVGGEFQDNESLLFINCSTHTTLEAVWIWEVKTGNEPWVSLEGLYSSQPETDNACWLRQSSVTINVTGNESVIHVVRCYIIAGSRQYLNIAGYFTYPVKLIVEKPPKGIDPEQEMMFISKGGLGMVLIGTTGLALFIILVLLIKLQYQGLVTVQRPGGRQNRGQRNSSVHENSGTEPGGNREADLERGQVQIRDPEDPHTGDGDRETRNKTPQTASLERSPGNPQTQASRPDSLTTNTAPNPPAEASVAVAAASVSAQRDSLTQSRSSLQHLQLILQQLGNEAEIATARILSCQAKRGNNSRGLCSSPSFAGKNRNRSWSGRKPKPSTSRSVHKSLSKGSQKKLYLKPRPLPRETMQEGYGEIQTVRESIQRGSEARRCASRAHSEKTRPGTGLSHSAKINSHKSIEEIQTESSMMTISMYESETSLNTDPTLSPQHWQEDAVSIGSSQHISQLSHKTEVVRKDLYFVKALNMCKSYDAKEVCTSQAHSRSKSADQIKFKELLFDIDISSKSTSDTRLMDSDSKVTIVESGGPKLERNLRSSFKQCISLQNDSEIEMAFPSATKDPVVSFKSAKPAFKEAAPRQVTFESARPTIKPKLKTNGLLTNQDSSMLAKSTHRPHLSSKESDRVQVHSQLAESVNSSRTITKQPIPSEPQSQSTCKIQADKRKSSSNQKINSKKPVDTFFPTQKKNKRYMYVQSLIPGRHTPTKSQTPKPVEKTKAKSDHILRPFYPAGKVATRNHSAGTVEKVSTSLRSVSVSPNRTVGTKAPSPKTISPNKSSSCKEPATDASSSNNKNQSPKGPSIRSAQTRTSPARRPNTGPSASTDKIQPSGITAQSPRPIRGPPPSPRRNQPLPGGKVVKSAYAQTGVSPKRNLSPKKSEASQKGQAVSEMNTFAEGDSGLFDDKECTDNHQPKCEQVTVHLATTEKEDRGDDGESLWKTGEGDTEVTQTICTQAGRKRASSPKKTDSKSSAQATEHKDDKNATVVLTKGPNRSPLKIPNLTNRSSDPRLSLVRRSRGHDPVVYLSTPSPVKSLSLGDVELSPDLLTSPSNTPESTQIYIQQTPGPPQSPLAMSGSSSSATAEQEVSEVTEPQASLSSISFDETSSCERLAREIMRIDSSFTSEALMEQEYFDRLEQKILHDSDTAVSVPSRSCHSDVQARYRNSMQARVREGMPESVSAPNVKHYIMEQASQQGIRETSIPHLDARPPQACRTVSSGSRGISKLPTYTGNPAQTTLSSGSEGERSRRGGIPILKNSPGLRPKYKGQLG